MANRLNPKVVSVSLAVAGAALSLLCALLLALAPAASLRFFGSIFHGIDVSTIAAPVTVNGVLTGLGAIVIVALVSGWLFAVVYNYFSRKMR